MVNLKKRLILGFLIAMCIISIPTIYAQEIETGIIGEYELLEDAQNAANEAEKDDEVEKIETSITTESRPYIEDSISYDELFSTRIGAMGGAEIFRLAYLLRGYDVSDAVIETKIIRETETEERTFNSLAEIQAYRALQELAGYDLDIRIVDLGITTRESNQESVDETFDSVLGLVRYLISLAQDHNRFSLQYENASYVITTDEDVTQTFSNRIDALNYLLQLNLEYQVTNGTITYDEGGTTVTEHVDEVFISEEDAQNYCDNLENDGYSLENIEINEISSEEIDIEEVLNSNNISINTDDINYTGITALGNSNVVIYFLDDSGERVTANGTISLSEIIINGQSYRPLANSLILNIANNTPVTIKGTITSDYCTRYTSIFGRNVCTQYKTFDFVSNGIINADNNGETNIITRNTFLYIPNSFDYTGNTISVDDNLIHIFKLSLDKNLVYNNPTYTVNAHIHRDQVVYQIRVYGNVSNIEILPVFTLRINKSRDITRYNALVTATLTNEKDVYIVNYTKTTKDIPVTTEETLNSENIDNPYTGDHINNYLVIFIISIISLCVCLISLKKEVKNY